MVEYDLNVDGETPNEGEYWITIHVAKRLHTARYSTCRKCRYWTRGVTEKALKARVEHEKRRMREVCGRRMEVRFCAICGGGWK